MSQYLRRSIVTIMSINLNKRNINIQGNATKLLMTLSCLVIAILINGQFSFVQARQIEKDAPKNEQDKTTTSPSIKEPAIIITRLPTATAKSAGKSIRENNSKQTTKKSKKTILVRFVTPEPKQEVWKGEKKLGVSNSKSTLAIRLVAGNHMIQVKDSEGKIIAKPTLINVSRKNRLFKIKPDPIVAEEPPKEKLVKEKEAVEQNVAQKINGIMNSYADPIKSSTVKLEDWEYIYQKALTNTSQDFTAIQIEAHRWFSSGQIDLAKGNYDNAYGAFTKSVEFMPGSAFPYYALGEAYTANKKFVEAFSAYQKAIQTDPKFALAHGRVGDIHLSANRSKDATASYKAAIKNGFDTPTIHFGLAKAHKKNRQWDDASKELEYVVKEEPTGEVYIELGDLYVQSKRNISAFEAYKKATELSSDSAPAFLKLAEILNTEREYERSKTAAEKALELDKEGKTINLGIARKLVREASQKLK